MLLRLARGARVVTSRSSEQGERARGGEQGERVGVASRSSEQVFLVSNARARGVVAVYFWCY